MYQLLRSWTAVSPTSPSFAELSSEAALTDLLSGDFTPVVPPGVTLMGIHSGVSSVTGLCLGSTKVPAYL